jgi:hypothetical protein
MRHARLALAARVHAGRCHSSGAWILCGPAELLACARAGRRDWYSQIRAYFDKEHTMFEYDFFKQRITRRL